MRRTMVAAVLGALMVLAGCADEPVAGELPPPVVTSTAGPLVAGRVAGLRVLPPSSHVTGVYPARCRLLAGPRPDVACTPGSVRSDVSPVTLAQTVCRPGWAASVRPSSYETDRVKTAAMVAYGEAPATRASTEFDHHVPIELGGTNDVTNLWPEPGPGPTTYNPKDTVENRLHDAVCARRVTLVAAQTAIASDWTTAEHRLGLR